MHEKYNVWRYDGEDINNTTELVAMFFDFTLAREFCDAEHGGACPYFVIQDICTERMVYTSQDGAI